MEEPYPRKRPRPVVSCLRCREKKLRCDRTTPCQNCVKAHIAHSCQYNHSRHMPSKDVSPHPSVGLAETVEDLQTRLAKVEGLLGLETKSGTNAMTTETSPQLLGTVVVKGARSVYHGQNDRTTLLNQFLDVKESINEITKDENLMASVQQIKFLQNRSRAKAASPESVREPEMSLALLKMREFLPSRIYCDRLVTTYCRHFERTLRILHIPTFMRQYDDLWASGNSDAYTGSIIVPQLTAVMSMAYHMDDAGNLSDDQTYKSYLKGAAIDLIQTWLDERSRKERTELATLQVEILLLLSRSLRGMQPEKLWSSTGAIVRSAMVMGLNVDPTTLPQMLPYHTEMRRRLWATILEIDLQASMTCGMPLIVPDLEQASAEPSNINDSDFDESSAALPSSRSTETYTDNLYQVILASSLPYRLKALSLVQRAAPNMQEAVSLGRKIEDCISRKPQLLGLHNANGTPIDGASLLHRVLLDLYLRRPLLCLYKPLLMAQTKSSIHEEVRRYCLECSEVILAYQNLYTISALGMITESPWAHQNFFYQCCKMDILWAALALCQHIKQLRRLESVDLEAQQGLARTVEFTIHCLINRIGQKGSDLKDIVFLALALQSVQLSESPPRRTQILQQVMQKTIAACKEVLLHSIISEETTWAAKSMNTLSSAPMPTTTSAATTPPTSESNSTSKSLNISMETTESAEQWFTNLPGLAVDFNTVQADMLSSNDALNFGVTQDWNWEHLWQ